MINRVLNILFKSEKPILGRWGLKTCNDLSANINSIYQNRDHCGDTICKTPKRASEYPSKISQISPLTGIKNTNDK